MLRMLNNSVKSFSTVDFDIDFNDASDAWRENKNVLPNGCFKYNNDRKCKKNVRYNM
jgi:hypothetical protein